MDARPNFCSECGAKLTGSATFCSSCGAKQAFAAVAATPQTAPAPTPAPVSTPSPAAVAAPAPAPVSAPANSLAAPKVRLSVPAMILGAAALVITLLAIVLQFVNISRGVAYKVDPHLFGSYIRQRGVLLGMFTACVVPMVAILVTLLKKKPIALVGLILTGVCMLFQFVAMLYFSQIVTGRVPANFFGRFIIRLYGWVNGEALLYTLWRNLRSGIWAPRAYFNANMISMIFYRLKNILSLVGCLLVVTRKPK